MNKIKHFIRAHLGAAIAATATGVVLVGGILILTLAGGATGTPSPAGVSAAPTTTTTAPPAPGAGAAHHHQGLRGHITAITAASWTVTSARGASVTVEVTPSTAFGSKAAPLAASDFSVGDTVVVSGTRTKTTVIATRIGKPKAATTAPTTTVP